MYWTTYRALTQALIAAFDLNSLRSMTLTKLDLVLDNVVAVERPVPAIALDLVQQVVDDQSIGIKGLLTAALAQNPGNPELQRLNAEWNDLVFDTATPCPYPGMSPFGEDQSDRFFGRNREVDEAIQRLRLFPFLVIIGASGSGKSSLVFAVASHKCGKAHSWA
ncbi:MAG: hypothetical protein IPK16_20675 [Anaerolineales bacterium]|nr:hypothetical protein [Anaerolineales bacterium]